jgi:hypothetical protein
MAAHRNRLIENLIENNGSAERAAGIRIRGETNDLVFERNVIRDTRQGGLRTQTTGILIEPEVGEVTLIDNTIKAKLPIDDRRRSESD